ncbi:hypothetical protein [Longimicrobium sp.]|uniref:hypothetical protein n=1 Tax=Longimicrobium sp. TaxID=2029185 RepID=UPI003B3B4BF4
MTEEATLADLLQFDKHIADPLRERVRILAERWPLPKGKLRSAAVDQVVERVRDRLSPRLYRVLAAAWRHHPACQEYCDPVKHPPSEVNTVELAEHKVEWACEPVVEVIADGTDSAGLGRLASLEFAIKVVAKVRAGVVTIQDARFVKMEAMKLVLEAKISVETVSIARFEVPVSLPVSIRFGEHGEPICLPVEPAEAPAAASTQIAVPAIIDGNAARVGSAGR